MKIELEYPYSTKWKCGYLATNKENRATLVLYNSPKDKTSTQYARYLLSVYLKRFLTAEETVDHIDGDVTNNSITNLQILSNVDNVRKSQKKPDFELVCPVCKKHFIVSRKKVSGVEKKKRIERGEMCCSRHCSGIFSHRFRGG